MNVECMTPYEVGMHQRVGSTVMGWMACLHLVRLEFYEIQLTLHFVSCNFGTIALLPSFFLVREGI